MNEFWTHPYMGLFYVLLMLVINVIIALRFLLKPQERKRIRRRILWAITMILWFWILLVVFDKLDAVWQFFRRYSFELFFFSLGLLILSIFFTAVFIKIQEGTFKTLLYKFLSYVVALVVLASPFLIYFTLKMSRIQQEILEGRPDKRPQRLILTIRPVTSWVESQFSVYIIVYHQLLKINIDGTNPEYVFKGDDIIREYHFSPDGRSLLILTKQGLYHLDRETQRSRLMDYLKGWADGEVAKGVIGGIQWAPDSRKFCYEVSQWTQYGSQDRTYIYDLETNEKISISPPLKKASSFFWDEQGKNLYYSIYETKRQTPTPLYGVKIFRIPLTTLESEGVVHLEAPESELPFVDTEPLGVKLFIPRHELSFGRAGRKVDSWASELGSRVALDNEGYLSYQDVNGERKRLFLIPRDPKQGHPIRQLRWIPGGRYVILTYASTGVLILEPQSGRVGLLVPYGKDFGWFPEE
jgi:hypothetical protein